MNSALINRFKNSLSYLWLIVVAGYLIVSAGQAMVRNYRSQQQTDTLQQQLSDLQLEQQRLEGLLVYYNTDTYKEQALRQNFLLVMPGERVYALPESGNVRSLEAEALQPVQQPTSAQQKQSIAPDWQQWLNYLL